MADPLQHAKLSDAQLYPEVRAYMPSLLPRIAFNYMTLMMIAVLVSVVLVRVLENYIWESTANTIAFGINLALLVYGWRWLERRNQATSLFIIYTRYSRHRRELLKALEQATSGKLADLDSLYTLVDFAEESGNQFVQMAQEQNLQRIEKEKS